MGNLASQVFPILHGTSTEQFLPLSPFFRQPLKDSGVRILVVLYPSKKELNGEGNYEAFVAMVTRNLSAEIEVYDLKNDLDWTANIYRDSIHPTPEGYRGLAAKIRSLILTEL